MPKLLFQVAIPAIQLARDEVLKEFQQTPHHQVGFEDKMGKAVAFFFNKLDAKTYRDKMTKDYGLKNLAVRRGPEHRRYK